MQTSGFIPARFRLPAEYNDPNIYDGFRKEGVSFAYFGFTALGAMLNTHERLLHDWEWSMIGGGGFAWHTFSEATDPVEFAPVLSDMRDFPTLYTAGNLIAFELVTVDPAKQWQAALRSAQLAAHKVQAEKDAAEAAEKAAKEAEAGAALARVLSKLLDQPIEPLLGNEWVSPDGIGFSLDTGSFKEGPHRDTNGKVICWWFKLWVWKRLPDEVAHFFSTEVDIPVSTAEKQAFTQVIDADWSEAQTRVANMVDYAEQRYEDIIRRYHKYGGRPDASNQPAPAVPLTARQKFMNALDAYITDVIANNPVEY
jgi:hypothetical protein